MTQRPHITCKELLDFLMDYVEGHLPTERRAEFERHLSACPSCTEYLKSYIETIRLGRAAMSGAGDKTLPAVPEELIRAILEARKE